MATSEELIGIIGDITDAVRAQHQSSKNVTSRTQDQIQEHSQAVTELSTSVRTQSSSSASTLRLPPLSLPKFTGGEFLDRFLDQISQVLSFSNVDQRFWIPYLCGEAAGHELQRFSQYKHVSDFLSFYNRFQQPSQTSRKTKASRMTMLSPD